MVSELLKKLLKSHKVFAPVKNGDIFVIKEIKNAWEADYSGKITSNSWKNLFLPAKEQLFDFDKNKIIETKIDSRVKTIAWCMNILDLKALGLYDLVFSRDYYYQRNRNNLVIVGLAVGGPAKFSDWQIFSHNLEENIPEHLPFDIFLEKMTNNDYKIYTGTEKGEKLLEANNLKDYQHITYSGLIPEEGPDKKMLALQKKMRQSKASDPIWQSLGNICLACGKCSMVCPTCFCFDVYDEATGKERSKRIRAWGNCFYPDFSKYAGNQSVLNNVDKKIHFWYEHKFSRIPADYSVPGCVSCLRCNQVCPVGIKIKETLKTLSNDQ